MALSKHLLLCLGDLLNSGWLIQYCLHFWTGTWTKQSNQTEIKYPAPNSVFTSSVSSSEHVEILQLVSQASCSNTNSPETLGNIYSITQQLQFWGMLCPDPAAAAFRC